MYYISNNNSVILLYIQYILSVRSFVDTIRKLRFTNIELH